MYKDINYLADILLSAIISIRENMNEVTANQVTENLLSNSDWHVLAEYMEDAIEQSNFDTVLVKEQLVYFLKTDNYWITWTKKCAQLF